MSNSPASLETVWGALESLVQITSVPTLMVKVAGSKTYFEPCMPIFTCAIATGVDVGVRRMVDVGVGWAWFVLEPALELPQATTNRPISKRRSITPNLGQFC